METTDPRDKPEAGGKGGGEGGGGGQGFGSGETGGSGGACGSAVSWTAGPIGATPAAVNAVAMAAVKSAGQATG